MSKLRKIIAGGQTGVDQAALQAAIDSELDHGGWCPPGRLCESGKIPEQFKLDETPKERDQSAPDIPRSQRTIWNVRDSDGSLIFLNEKESKMQRDKGTELALKTSKKLGKSFLVVDVQNLDSSRSDAERRSETVIQIKKWNEENEIEVLSVNGPSEGNEPGIYEKVYKLLVQVLSAS